jgi:N-acetylneuraminic acid mutarotase
MFVDDDGCVFVDDTGCIFDDTTGVMRISTEYFNGNYEWPSDVLDIQPISWRCDSLHGGYVRLGGVGSIEISMKAFSDLGWWFPATSYKITISHTSGIEDSAIVLMSGTLHLSEVKPPLSLIYNIHSETYDQDLLSTVTNYDGETVPEPMAFGAVNYVTPVRLADTDIKVNSWRRKADFPGIERERASCAVVGNKIYVGMGINLTTFLDIDDFWAYDTSDSIWVQETSFAGGKRYSAAAAAVGTKIYVGCGYSVALDATMSDWWEYDTESFEWTKKEDFPSTGRVGAVCVSVGTIIYYGTGGTLKDWWAYDTVANTWTAKTDFGGTARYGAVAAAVGTKIYVGTGYGGGANKKDWWAYDTVANTWASKTDLTGGARSAAVAAAVGTKIYIGTGFTDGFYWNSKDWWEYDTVANSWSLQGEIGGASREFAVSAAVGTKIYVGTGYGHPLDEYAYLLKDWWALGATDMVRQYSASGLTTITVYDDGVDVTSKATQPSNNVWTYGVTPVGELTISGTKSTLQSAEDIFTSLCGSSYLNSGVNNAETGAYNIDKWQTEQIKVVDFLSKIAAVENWFFYFLGGACHVGLLSAGYVPYLYVHVESDAIRDPVPKYTLPEPVSILRAKWNDRTAVEESIGKYVKETSQEESKTSAYPYGSEMEIEAFTETRATALARLTAIEAFYSQQQASFSMPFVGSLIFPGTRIYITDERYTGHETSDVQGYVRDVILDFMGKKISIEGKGSFNDV